MKYNKSDYKVGKQAKEHFNVLDKDGNRSVLAFDSHAAAKHYINSRADLGQDPMDFSTDFDSMNDTLLNG